MHFINAVFLPVYVLTVSPTAGPIAWPTAGPSARPTAGPVLLLAAQTMGLIALFSFWEPRAFTADELMSKAEEPVSELVRDPASLTDVVNDCWPFAHDGGVVVGLCALAG